MLHGIRSSGTMWRPQVEALSRLGHEVVAVDLPGHGRNAGVPFTLAAARAEITRVIAEETHHPDWPLAVVGLSLGGYVALDWTARIDTHPDLLVLSSSTTVPGGILHRGYQGFTELFGALGADGAEWASNTSARMVLGKEAADDIGAGGISVEGQKQALQAMLEAKPLEDLRAVVDQDIPVAFIQGEWDHFRLHEGRFRDVAGPDARWYRIRNAIHMVSSHRPRAYTRALLQAMATTPVREGADDGDAPEPAGRESRVTE